MTKINIITPTCQRPQMLAMQLNLVKNQVKTACFEWEQIVISDGPDPLAAALCQHFGVQYEALPARQRNFGAPCRDRGMELASGDYVCFWDDDNYYAPNALQKLLEVTQHADIGIVQTEHWLTSRNRFTRIPKNWTGVVVPGQIDTMCLCLRREFAIQEKWHQPPFGRGTDHRWLKRLLHYEPKIHFEPVLIGQHMPAVVSGLRTD